MGKPGNWNDLGVDEQREIRQEITPSRCTREGWPSVEEWQWFPNGEIERAKRTLEREGVTGAARSSAAEAILRYETSVGPLSKADMIRAWTQYYRQRGQPMPQWFAREYLFDSSDYRAAARLFASAAQSIDCIISHHHLARSLQLRGCGGYLAGLREAVRVLDSERKAYEREANRRGAREARPRGGQADAAWRNLLRSLWHIEPSPRIVHAFVIANTVRPVTLASIQRSLSRLGLRNSRRRRPASGTAPKH